LEDPGLTATIQNCLAKALHPENIIFGISLQYDVDPNLDFVSTQSRIIRFPKPNYDTNTGPGIIEIRNAIKRLHKDEEYFLQIDSHTDFAKNWDDILIHDVHEFKNKTIISKQIQQKELEETDMSKFIFNPSKSPILYTTRVSDTEYIKNNLVNKNYFYNHYISGGFIFAKSKWLYEVPLSNYHKFPYEEQEQSLISYCHGYDIVAPRYSRQVIFAGNDSKYENPKNELWWDIEKIDETDPTTWIYTRKWIKDNEPMTLEVEKLLLFGKNDFMDITNRARTLTDFYSVIGLGKEYKQYFAELQGGAHSKTFLVKGYDSKEGMFNARMKKADPNFREEE
jgi:hypothetical protein